MIWLLMAFTFQAFAGTVLLQGSQAPAFEYKAMLKRIPGWFRPPKNI